MHCWFPLLPQREKLTQSGDMSGQNAEITAKRWHIDLLHFGLIVKHFVGGGEGQLHGISVCAHRLLLQHANATGGQHSGGSEQRHDELAFWHRMRALG